MRMLAILLTAGVLVAQETPLTRLKREANSAFEPRHQALRDWIEWRLPRFENSLTNFTQLEAAMTQELNDAGILFDPSTDEMDPMDIKSGFASFRFEQFPKLQHALFVVASVTVPCGTDDAVYLYHYGPAGRSRVFEDHPKSDNGYWGPEITLSDPDFQRRRLLALHYETTQCASMWRGMAYSVYRLSTSTASADLLLKGDHGFYLADSGVIFALKPDELFIEFYDRSIDSAVFCRTYIERFNLAEGPHRLDPIALQPRDFVEEWLVWPWSEIESRSAAATKSCHDKLHKDDVSADFHQVVKCADKPDRWLIGLDIENHRRTSWFLVHDLGNYRYEMESVSEVKPKGCPGPGPSRENAFDTGKPAWLSAEELKALP